MIADDFTLTGIGVIRHSMFNAYRPPLVGWTFIRFFSGQNGRFSSRRR